MVDCDGILSDFVTPTLELIYLHTGDRHTHEEITQWDVFAATGKKQHEHILTDAVTRGGFCASLPVLAESQDGVEKLRKLGDVYVVTSPFDAPSWVYERTKWLEKFFGFTKKQIVNTAAKYVVAGDVLIDDSERNLKEWKEHMDELGIDALPVLLDSPWNRHVDHDGVHRVHNWDTLVESVRNHVESPHAESRPSKTRR